MIPERMPRPKVRMRVNPITIRILFESVVLIAEPVVLILEESLVSIPGSKHCIDAGMRLGVATVAAVIRAADLLGSSIRFDPMFATRIHRALTTFRRLSGNIVPSPQRDRAW